MHWLGLRADHLSYHDRAGHSHDRGGQEMRGKQHLLLWIRSAQHADIGTHHRSGNRAHTCHHHQEELRGSHSRQVMLDHHWRLRHTHKNIPRRDQSLST